MVDVAVAHRPPRRRLVDLVVAARQMRTSILGAAVSGTPRSRNRGSTVVSEYRPQARATASGWCSLRYGTQRYAPASERLWSTVQARRRPGAAPRVVGDVGLRPAIWIRLAPSRSGVDGISGRTWRASQYHPGVPRKHELGLSPGDWGVLGLVAEGATHGFAVAQLMAPGGDLGRIWSLPRPLVYQALKKLAGQALIAERAVESSDRGPRRTIVAVTPRGRRAIAGWLSEPVEHVRDVRSLLLLKLALIDRRGADPSLLLAGQRHVLVPVVASLEEQLNATAGFEKVLATWRLESSKAVLRFLDQANQRPHRAAASAG
jgi:DNA-binding PadR family transcriptional regulator